MGRDFFWSDLHLGHANIIKYCNRPFSSVEEMNDLIIKNWRKTITNDDTIYNLGDFCFNWNREKISSLLSSLPGKKVLVLGNHDRRFKKQISWWISAGFDKVYDCPIIYKKWFILSHETVFLNETMPYINIHGHIHQHSFDTKCYRNVSVDVLNYLPTPFESLFQEEES